MCSCACTTSFLHLVHRIPSIAAGQWLHHRSPISSLSQVPATVQAQPQQMHMPMPCQLPLPCHSSLLLQQRRRSPAVQASGRRQPWLQEASRAHSSISTSTNGTRVPAHGRGLRAIVLRNGWQKCASAGMAPLAGHQLRQQRRNGSRSSGSSSWIGSSSNWTMQTCWQSTARLSKCQPVSCLLICHAFPCAMPFAELSDGFTACCKPSS